VLDAHNFRFQGQVQWHTFAFAHNLVSTPEGAYFVHSYCSEFGKAGTLACRSFRTGHLCWSSSPAFGVSSTPSSGAQSMAMGLTLCQHTRRVFTGSDQPSGRLITFQFDSFVDQVCCLGVGTP